MPASQVFYVTTGSNVDGDVNRNRGLRAEQVSDPSTVKVNDVPSFLYVTPARNAGNAWQIPHPLHCKCIK